MAGCTTCLHLRRLLTEGYIDSFKQTALAHLLSVVGI